MCRRRRFVSGQIREFVTARQGGSGGGRVCVQCDIACQGFGSGGERKKRALFSFPFPPLPSSPPPPPPPPSTHAFLAYATKCAGWLPAGLVGAGWGALDKTGKREKGGREET